MLDPLDDGCQPDPDPRISHEDRVRLIGEQWGPRSRYVLTLDERPGRERVELRDGDHTLTDRTTARVLTVALRIMDAS